jgi:hypothetical protein
MSEIDNKIKAKDVLVAGLARNCASSLKADVLRLQHSLVDFNQVYWLIIESDSSDDTLVKLEELTAEIPCFNYISLGVLSEKYPLRTERIAFCRNTYIKELKENPIYKQIEFVIVADFDGINNLISKKAIATCFTRDDWDVCTSNQQGRYYDIWALRHKVWCPNDCWEQASFFQRYGLDKIKAQYSAVYSKMLI